MKRAVVTVIGCDTVGIIAKVSGYLAETNVNILDISQTIMRDLFAMMMLVDIAESKVSFGEISDSLGEIGKTMGLQIQIQHADLFHSMHKI